MTCEAIATATDPRADNLARELLALAAGENVRVLEALAEVLSRGGIAGAAEEPAPGLAEPPAPYRIAGGDGALGGVCQRIARRAVAGCLPDRTRGATAFHRLGEPPCWARGLAPVAEVGPFVFYRLSAAPGPD